jgi:hypothetical protein
MAKRKGVVADEQTPDDSVRLDIERSFWLDRPAPSLIAPLTQNAQYCAVAARHRL